MFSSVPSTVTIDAYFAPSQSSMLSATPPAERPPPVTGVGASRTAIVVTICWPCMVLSNATRQGLFAMERRLLQAGHVCNVDNVTAKPALLGGASLRSATPYGWASSQTSSCGLLRSREVTEGVSAPGS